LVGILPFLDAVYNLEKFEMHTCWSAEEVASEITNIGLGKYSRVFVEQEIDCVMAISKRWASRSVPAFGSSSGSLPFLSRIPCDPKTAPVTILNRMRRHPLI
jgi:hypothetical protein